MDGYIISIQNNSLKINLAGTEQAPEKTLSIDINNHEALAEEIGALILETFGPKPQKLPLNFLVGPEDLFLNFITVSKGNNAEEQLLELAKSKLGTQGVAIENLYYSHQKIAPFVYQLIGVKMEILEKYIQISTDLGFELQAVIPWVLLLPKHSSNSGKPAIFMLSVGETKYLALSELGGIYHLGLLDNTKSSSELEELIQKLSVYQRNAPITDIYTLNVSGLDLGEKYSVSPLDITDLHSFVVDAFNDAELFGTQANLLTLLPLPTVEKKASPMVYVGAVVGALLLVGTFFGVKGLNSKANDTNIAMNADDTPVVLSNAEEATPSASEGVEEDTEEIIELNRALLRIRVENGTSLGGLAGRTQDSLIEIGYDVVGIGDSEDSDRVETLVNINLGNILYKDMLLSDLSEIFGAVEIKEDLNDNLDYDVLIVAGSDDGKSAE